MFTKNKISIRKKVMEIIENRIVSAQEEFDTKVKALEADFESAKNTAAEEVVEKIFAR